MNVFEAQLYGAFARWEAKQKAAKRKAAATKKRRKANAKAR